MRLGSAGGISHRCHARVSGVLLVSANVWLETIISANRKRLKTFLPIVCTGKTNASWTGSVQESRRDGGRGFTRGTLGQYRVPIDLSTLLTDNVSADFLGEMGTPMTKFSTLCVLGTALLMAGCVSQQKYEASQQRNAELEAQYEQLNQTMGSEIAARELHISRMQDAIRVSLNDDLLFPSGGSEMSSDAKASVAKVAAILAPHQRNRIDVNGYTDSTPIGPELEKQGITTNLILSQKRADTVMQFMISQGVKANLVSAHGYGEANPVASNDTPEGRAQNRRVELTIASPGD